MRPIIGITPSVENGENIYFINADNAKAITAAGGTPIILPLLESKDDIENAVQIIDGLYLSGGNDVDPTLFDEEPHPQLGIVDPKRDKFESAIIREVLKLNKPILGVCKGCQMLNIVGGGDMYQDIYSQIEGNLLQHNQNAPSDHGSHFVEVLEGSLLHQLVGLNKIKVNSRHHQANRKMGENFIVSGKASDGVVEAIESKQHPFVLGLQWHPENMVAVQDEVSQKIYKGFINACRSR